MSRPPPPANDRSVKLLIAVLGVVMGAFVITSLVAQRTSAKTELLSERIVSVSSPSIERLASMRSVVFEVQLALSESLRRGVDGGARLASLDRSLEALDDDVRGYLTLPILQDEESYWRQIDAAIVRFDGAVRRTRELIRSGELGDAQEELSTQVEPSGRELIEAALNAIAFHARSSRESAAEMRDARRRANVFTNFSSAICVAFGIAGLILIRNQARRHRALVHAHAQFHEARAAEYEQFAGRVAHDIRNPLSAAGIATEVALRHASDERQRERLDRVRRALWRAESITSALLDFARAGAQPDPGARTSAREALEDFIAGLSPEAERLGIELCLETVPDVGVACSPGVYLILVGNLVRNAIKYMGPAEPRRITVRVSEEGANVRTEVVDTGPGIAAEHLVSLFEPYFRVGRDRTKEGLGLGLATVRKLTDGHHGEVGVRSEPGKGSTFWFVLPRAGTAWSPVDAPQPGEPRPETRH
jgi:signal transduction histidine kinase